MERLNYFKAAWIGMASVLLMGMLVDAHAARLQRVTEKVATKKVIAEALKREPTLRNLVLVTANQADPEQGSSVVAKGNYGIFRTGRNSLRYFILPLTVEGKPATYDESGEVIFLSDQPGQESWYYTYCSCGGASRGSGVDYQPQGENTCRFRRTAEGTISPLECEGGCPGGEECKCSWMGVGSTGAVSRHTIE